jgi:hypothetical protein
VLGPWAIGFPRSRSSPFPTRSLRFDRAPSAARFHERFDSQAENSFSVRRTVQSLPSRLRPRGPQVCSPTEFSSSPPPASLRPAPHRTRKPDTVNRHCWRLPWGSRSLFATSPVGVHARGFPTLQPFRPQRFTRSRRLSPPTGLRVCFTPLPRPGFHPPGFLLACSCAVSSTAHCPLVVVGLTLPMLPPAPRHTAPPSGLDRSRARLRRTDR